MANAARPVKMKATARAVRISMRGWPRPRGKAFRRYRSTLCRNRFNIAVMAGEIDRNSSRFHPQESRLTVLVIAKVDPRLTARRVERLVYGLGIAGNHGQIGARRLVGLRGALLPVAQRAER